MSARADFSCGFGVGVPWFEGTGNASVEVAMYSLEVPVPLALASNSIWIEDGFTKKDRVLK